MTMEIAVIGINHRSAPVDLREKLAMPERELPQHLQRITSDPDISEACILSTCNRVELYCVVSEGADAYAKLSLLLARLKGLELEAFGDSFYFHSGLDAVTHLFRVASGLDSMVLGETEVQGQVRHSYALAHSLGATGRFLNPLFQRALSVSKRIRSQTAISVGKASVSSVAVEFAKKVFGSLSERTALIIGVGETAELTLKSALAEGVRGVLVTNRTFKKAQELARAYDGEAFPFSQLAENLHRADILISGTSAPHFVLYSSQLSSALKRRRGKPILIIDIAVPRDIDPSVQELEGVYLYNIDDLEAVVEETLRHRQAELPHCEAIIEEESLEFFSETRAYNVSELISTLNRTFEEIRRSELEWLIPKLTSLSEEDRKRVEQMTHRLVRKILHCPIEALRKYAADGAHPSFFETVKRLFKL